MSNNESDYQVTVFPEHFSKQQIEDFEHGMDLIYVANGVFDRRAEAARNIAKEVRLSGIRIETGKPELYLPDDANYHLSKAFHDQDKQFEHLNQVAGALMPLEVNFVDSSKLD